MFWRERTSEADTEWGEQIMREMDAINAMLLLQQVRVWLALGPCPNSAAAKLHERS